MRQFIQLENGSPKQYPIGAMDVHRYAPENTGFPLDCTDADLSEFGFETFALTDPPSFDPAKQRAVEGMPIKGKAGWYQAWSLVDLTADEVDARKPQVPQQVTPVQGRLALAQAGIYDKVLELVKSSDVATQIWFEYATVWERDNAILNAMAASLGMSSADVDALFIAAAAT